MKSLLRTFTPVIGRTRYLPSVGTTGGTSPEILAYLRHVVETAIAGGDKPGKIAERGGITPAAVSQIRDKKRGIGWKTLNGLATAFGKRLSEIESEASAWAADNPEEIEKAPEPDRYPFRTMSIEWARAAGYPQAAIDEVASMDLHSGGNDDVDPGGDYWMDMLRAARSRVLAAGGGPVKPGGKRPGAHERNALGGGPPKKRR